VKKVLVAGSLICLFVATAALGGGQIKPISGAIIIEGENPSQTDFIVDFHDPYHTELENGAIKVRTFAGLSHGRASLLSTKTKPAQEGYVASYNFEVPEEMSGNLWVFEQGRQWASPFSWRIGDGEWKHISTELLMQGKHNFKDGPQFTWGNLGKVHLSSGTHNLEIRVIEPKEGGQYLISQDCFVIVPKTPAGKKVEYYPFESKMERPTEKSIFLWDGKPAGSEIDDGFRPWVEPCLAATDKPLGAVLVCPGGGYRARSLHEGLPVAKRFNEKGLHAFVLLYRVAPHSPAEALSDAQRAIRIIREHADEWGVKPDHIAVCGFSAGAHLSGSLAMEPLAGNPNAENIYERHSTNPDAIILAYAPAFGTFEVEKGLPESFPPTFLWHTVEDKLVSVNDSLRISQALQKHNVPFEMHLYPNGRHGLGLAEGNPHVATWMDLCCDWLEEMGWK